jgi:UDP-N-acetylglucosamine 2-epimerase (non-hydrolysing)
MKISFVIGTRPELIKLAPIIWEAQKKDFQIDIVNSAQHTDLLDPFWKTFNLTPTHVLDVMLPGQSLSSLTARVLSQFQNYIDSCIEVPNIVIAQGDTTTVMAVSIVAFYNKIKFAHVEAGLRSFDFENPFPEEYNRKIAAICAQFHFCPTTNSAKNLLNEGLPEDNIFVVGNTVVDSLSLLTKSSLFKEKKWINPILNEINNFKRVVLVTCHRRENHGRNLVVIINAIKELAFNNQTILFVWPMHPNPSVKKILQDSTLNTSNNILLTDPLDYLDILKILDISFCAITDSGGIQEEAPSFGTPVLILREVTERPEGVTEGISYIVSSDKNKIIETFNHLDQYYPKFDQNPFGDGNSSKRIINELLKYSNKLDNLSDENTRS